MAHEVVADAVVLTVDDVVVVDGTHVFGASATIGSAHTPTHAHVRPSAHAPMSPIIVEPHDWFSVRSGVHIG